MKTLSDVMRKLKSKGSEQTRKTFARHGAPGDYFGVKVADLKPIAKAIQGNQALACELYETGNSDAMYLAGLVADGALMSKTELNGWAKTSTWYMLSEYTVPWVAAESPHARDLAMKWMRSKNASIASSGWCTYSSMIATQPDEELDQEEIAGLLDLVVEKIDDAPNRVRYTMNGFVIGVGAYFQPLLKHAKRAAKAIGKVSVDVGDTACKVPLATEYIAKIEKAGRLGKKRKSTKC